MKGKTDLIGKSFGRLTVLSFYGSIGKGLLFNCECACGNYKVLRGGDLRSGKTNSCGCLKRESLTMPRSHGYCTGYRENKKYTPEYLTLMAMKARCYNPKKEGYKYYGGRGITICKRWLKSFDNFINDMGPKPGPEYSIDRINTNGNYTPANCRWATPKEQAQNRRNRKLKFSTNGSTTNKTGASKTSNYPRTIRG